MLLINELDTVYASFMAIVDQLGLFHNFPNPEGIVSSTRGDGSFSRQSIDGRDSSLMAKPNKENAEFI